LRRRSQSAPITACTSTAVTFAARAVTDLMHAMEKLRVLISLITKDNDYQLEQAFDAKTSAASLQVETQIVYADSDPIAQGSGIIKAIQSDPSTRPHGVVVEPAGASSFAEAANAAAYAKIGWAVLSRVPEYTDDLQDLTRSPIFSVSADDMEVGRIQGRQVNALLPRGGSVLWVEGPSVSSAALDRHGGFSGNRQRQYPRQQRPRQMDGGKRVSERTFLARSRASEKKAEHRPCRRPR
jgi:ABC-type sugar transport system substrate-binding protein